MKRRIRIEGKPDDTVGYLMAVRDLETGELIEGIYEITVHIQAEGRNSASYALLNERTRIDAPEVAVTAYDDNPLHAKGLQGAIEAVKAQEKLERLARRIRDEVPSRIKVEVNGGAIQLSAGALQLVTIYTENQWDMMKAYADMV